MISEEGKILRFLKEYDIVPSCSNCSKRKSRCGESPCELFLPAVFARLAK